MKDSTGAVQSILVLGGGSEIALATCRRLAGRRARTIVLAARRTDELAEAERDLKEAGASDVASIAFDATAYDTHERFVDEVWERFGDSDLVIVAFGVLGDQERAATDHDAAVRMIETNFTGAVSVAVPITARFTAQGHGQFVVLSTVAGERVRKSNFTYGASKAGLDGYFCGLGDRLAGTGVSVMVVRPGFVRTKMTEGLDDAPLATTADGVADDIVRGLEKGREVVWSPATFRPVMSALRHLPRAAWRRLPF